MKRLPQLRNRSARNSPSPRRIVVLRQPWRTSDEMPKLAKQSDEYLRLNLIFEFLNGQLAPVNGGLDWYSTVSAKQDFQSDETSVSRSLRLFPLRGTSNLTG